MQATQPTFGGTSDALLLRLSPSYALEYSTYLGGAGNDQVTAMAANGGRLVAGGIALSVNLPVKNARQPVSGGNGDGWLATMELPVAKRRAVAK